MTEGHRLSERMLEGTSTAPRVVQVSEDREVQSCIIRANGFCPSRLTIKIQSQVPKDQGES